MPDPTAEVLQRLAGIEAKLESVPEIREEQIKQGKQLASIETTVAATGPRCDSHSRRIGAIEREIGPMRDLPRKVEALEATAGKRGFLAAVIGAVATALVLAGKWLLSAKVG